MNLAPSKPRWRAKIHNTDLSKSRDHIQIKIKMKNPSQEPPAPTKAQNQDLKDMDVLCIFKFKIESQNLEHGCIKDQWTYPNQDQDAKPHLGSSSVLQSPKSVLKGHICSLHLQKQYRKPKFARLMYQRPVTISKFRWRCKPPVQNLQCPPKLLLRTLRTWMFFAPSKSR